MRARQCPRVLLVGALSGHEWYSWVLQASQWRSRVLEASMNGARGCPKVSKSATNWCSKHPWVALTGAQNVLEGRLWVLQAYLSGTHGCSNASMSGAHGCSKVSMSGTHGCNRFPPALFSGLSCVRDAFVAYFFIASTMYSEMIHAGAPGCSSWTYVVGALSLAAL